MTGTSLAMRCGNSTYVAAVMLVMALVSTGTLALFAAGQTTYLQSSDGQRYWTNDRRASYLLLLTKDPDEVGVWANVAVHGGQEGVGLPGRNRQHRLSR